MKSVGDLFVIDFASKLSGEVVTAGALFFACFSIVSFVVHHVLELRDKPNYANQFASLVRSIQSKVCDPRAGYAASLEEIKQLTIRQLRIFRAGGSEQYFTQMLGTLDRSWHFEPEINILNKSEAEFYSYRPGVLSDYRGFVELTKTLSKNIAHVKKQIASAEHNVSAGTRDEDELELVRLYVEYLSETVSDVREYSGKIASDLELYSWLRRTQGWLLPFFVPLLMSVALVFLGLIRWAGF